MATTFLEPGGDADFSVNTTNGFWNVSANSPVVTTDFVHGGHQKSININSVAGSYVRTLAATLSDAGSRISLYLYIVTLPSSTHSIIALKSSGGGGAGLVTIRITNAGVLQLWNAETAQIGTDGNTLNTGQWYRISLAYTITSTSVNRFEIFLDGVSMISITNGTLGAIATSLLQISGLNGSYRISDIYIDNSSSLTDTGNIWVTAKRPVSNGTTNGFTTQIGSGGSGYGSGHSPQVNERALSTTNGWSMVGAGSAITEEYNIESKSTGDIDISTATIVDWLAWWSMSSLAGETLTTIFNGSTSTQAITSTATLYTKIVGSTTYPAGSGTDVGITTTTALTTVSLYECGVIVAYIPASGNTPATYTNPNLRALNMMGIGK